MAWRGPTDKEMEEGRPLDRDSTTSMTELAMLCGLEVVGAVAKAVNRLLAAAEEFKPQPWIRRRREEVLEEVAVMEEVLVVWGVEAREATGLVKLENNVDRSRQMVGQLELKAAGHNMNGRTLKNLLRRRRRKDSIAPFVQMITSQTTARCYTVPSHMLLSVDWQEMGWGSFISPLMEQSPWLHRSV